MGGAAEGVSFINLDFASLVSIDYSYCEILFVLETLSQRRFVEEVSGMMLGREAEVQVLLNYALGSNEGLKLGGNNMLV